MKSIITVSRQYGSMGSDISKIISNHYFIPLYRQEDIIHETQGVHAEKSMIGSNTSANNSFLYSLAMDVYSMEYSENSIQNMPIDHKKFIVQCDKIQQLARKGPAVFVGRASDYALSEFDNVISIFFYADLDKRIKRISGLQCISASEAKSKIVKIDKDRARYYNYYTTKKWGDPSSYDLCINTTKMTPEQCSEIVIQYIDYINKIKKSV